jgi:hypothetical protein
VVSTKLALVGVVELTPVPGVKRELPVAVVTAAAIIKNASLCADRVVLKNDHSYFLQV